MSEMMVVKALLEFLEKITSSWGNEDEGTYPPELVSALGVSDRPTSLESWYRKKAPRLEGYYLENGDEWFISLGEVVQNSDVDVEDDIMKETKTLTGGQAIIVRRNRELSEILVRPGANELEVLGFIIKYFNDYGLY